MRVLPLILSILLSLQSYALDSSKPKVLQQLKSVRESTNKLIVTANGSIFKLMNKVSQSENIQNIDRQETLSEELQNTVEFKNFNTVKVKVLNLLIIDVENKYNGHNLKTFLSKSLLQLSYNQTQTSNFDSHLWLALKNLGIAVQTKPEQNDNILAYFVTQLNQPSIVSTKFNLNDQVNLDYSNGKNFESARTIKTDEIGSNEELLNQLDLIERQKKLLRAPRLGTPVIKPKKTSEVN